jgi:hypothetical protein
MLTAGSPKAGSAAYVAIEKVSGTLGGRAGSFVLTHVGTMHAGAFQLQVAIAPGSGTGALQGIAGVLEIQNAAGDHTYELVYTLPESE